MTHDEMIEAVAKAIFACHFADTAEAQSMMQKDWNRPSPLMTMVRNEARAAIRVIAPAVLEEAAYCAAATNANCYGDPTDVYETMIDAIRALKPRYEA